MPEISVRFQFDPNEVYDCPFCPCPEPHQGTVSLFGVKSPDVAQMKMCIVCFINADAAFTVGQANLYTDVLEFFTKLTLANVNVSEDTARTGAAGWLASIGYLDPATEGFYFVLPMGHAERLLDDAPSEGEGEALPDDTSGLVNGLLDDLGIKYE